MNRFRHALPVNKWTHAPVQMNSAAAHALQALFYLFPNKYKKDMA